MRQRGHAGKERCVLGLGLRVVHLEAKPLRAILHRTDVGIVLTDSEPEQDGTVPEGPREPDHAFVAGLTTIDECR